MVAPIQPKKVKANHEFLYIHYDFETLEPRDLPPALRHREHTVVHQCGLIEESGLRVSQHTWIIKKNVKKKCDKTIKNLYLFHK
jgi:hypothetical protein